MNHPMVVDREGGMVLGYASGLNGLESVLDFESTGRRETSAKALHLMARGAHISGFVLRPDDGLSDVAIVSNGATRFLSPGEMQWLMHESKSPITVCPSDELERLRESADMRDEVARRLAEEANDLRNELRRLREAAREVVWSWGEATGHEDLPQCPMVARSVVEESIDALAAVLLEEGGL